MTIRITLPRLTATLLLLITVFAAAGFKGTERGERYGAVIGVKPEKLDYYKKLHASPWPAVNEAVKKANIRNYSIYLTQFDDGKWYLFSCFEYVGSDFEADMKILADDGEVKRWWKETDPCQIGMESRKAGDWWKNMEEVYHLE
jgi:L-rhamnose mutarotase